jgi:anti-anti-sigma factor
MNRVVVDLSDVTFLDARGISVIALARDRLRHDCDVVLRRPIPFVQKVLKITGMDGPCVIEECETFDGP